MKRSRAEAALSPSKAQRRQKASRPKTLSAAAERARPASTPENALKGGGDDKNPAAAAPDLQQSPPPPLAPAEEEVMGWMDGAGELGEWWWCLWGVEEDKLSGWFPFVDEDFLHYDARGGGEGSGGLLWEEADHDIWQLQHIHEIPHTAAK